MALAYDSAPYRNRPAGGRLFHLPAQPTRRSQTPLPYRTASTSGRNDRRRAGRDALPCKYRFHPDFSLGVGVVGLADGDVRTVVPHDDAYIAHGKRRLWRGSGARPRRNADQHCAEPLTAPLVGAAEAAVRQRPVNYAIRVCRHAMVCCHQSLGGLSVRLGECEQIESFLGVGIFVLSHHHVWPLVRPTSTAAHPLPRTDRGDGSALHVARAEFRASAILPGVGWLPPYGSYPAWRRGRALSRLGDRSDIGRLQTIPFLGVSER